MRPDDSPLYPVADWELADDTLLEHVSARTLELAADLVGLGRVSRSLRFERELVADVRGADMDYRCRVALGPDGLRFWREDERAKKPPPEPVAVLLLYLRAPDQFVDWPVLRTGLAGLSSDALLDLVAALLRDEELLYDVLAGSAKAHGGLAALGGARALQSTDPCRGLELVLEQLSNEFGQTPGVAEWRTMLALLVMAQQEGYQAPVLEWASQHFSGPMLQDLEPFERQQVLSTLLGASHSDAVGKLLRDWFDSVPPTGSWPELWRLSATSLLHATRARLLDGHVAAEGHYTGERAPLALERELVRLLGHLHLSRQNETAYRAVLSARADWFESHAPALAARELRWTAAELDRLGEEQASFAVLRRALDVARVRAEVIELRHELASRYMEHGQPQRALPYWLTNFEERPNWALFGYIQGALGDARVELSTQDVHAQLVTAALEAGNPQLALRLAIAVGDRDAVISLARHLPLDPVAATAPLVVQAGELLASRKAQQVLDVLRAKLVGYLQEKSSKDENEDTETLRRNLVNLAKLVRGYTLALEGQEAWRAFIKDAGAVEDLLR